MSTRHRGVRLVVGPPGPAAGGIEDAFLDHARRLQSGDPLRPVVVLAGSNMLRLRLRRVLAARSGGHANIRFLLLRDLARELGSPGLRDRGRRRLPDLGRDLLLRSVVQAHAHGTYFERIALTDGFLEALASTLTDLKEAGIEPALLRAAGAGMRAAGARLAQVAPQISGRKLEELAALHEAYDDLLQDRRFYDEADLMRSAVPAAEPAPEGTPPAVIVYGFYDLNWQQRALLKAYLSFRPATIFFPFESDAADNAWEFARPLLDWLRGWVPEVTELPAVAGRRAASLPAEVGIVSAPGEGREVVEAVRWMIGLARERSLPFGTMALLYRSGEEYRHLSSEIMAEAGGVPHFLLDGTPLGRTAAARALLLLLQARTRGDNLSRRTVMDLLALTDTTGQAALWDRLSREAGVVRGAGDWKKRLERLAADRERRGRADERGGDPSGVAAAARALAARVEEMGGALAAMPAGGRWSDLTAASIDLLHRFVPASLDPGAVARYLDPLGCLDEIVTPVSLEEFTFRVRSVLERAAVPTGQFERSGIFVGGVMEARLLSFDAVAVVGLVERGFPAPPREDPILLDDERDTINRTMGEERLPLKRRRLEEERLLFRLAVTSATECLRLSYPRLEPATARPRNPSPFLLRLAGAIAGASVDYDSLERVRGYESIGLSSPGPRKPGASILGREFDLGLLGRELPRAAEPETRRRLISFLRANPLLHRALEAEQARWGESRFTAHDGVILRPHVAEFLRTLHPAGDRPISPTRVERYATCPLRYFLEDVMGLQALDDPEDLESIDPRRRGALMHDILFELFTTLRARKALPVSPEGLPAALALLHEVAARRFQREEEEGMTGPRMVWEIEKERLTVSLERLLESEPRETRWIPAHFELGFGPTRFEGEPIDPASSLDPIMVELRAGQRILLKGRIDRVDLSRDGRALRVTDYKTGKTIPGKADAFKGGTSVQIPLYMLGASALLSRGGREVLAAEGRYLQVGWDGREVAYSGEALAGRRAELGQVLSTFVHGVERGVFFANPGEAQCRWCACRLACGEGREARFERKKGDATAQDFLAMKELL